MPVPRDHDRLLTGALLALAGVVVGAITAWALLRGSPAPERAPMVLVPAVSAPVAQVDPRSVAVHPSSAFMPLGGDQPRPAETTLAPTNTTTVTPPTPGAEDPRQAGWRPAPERARSSSRSEILVYPGVNSAFPIPAPGQPPSGGAGQINSIDDALSYALEGMDPYLKRGYLLREDTWGGDLPVGGVKTIAHQLFKGNDYRFCVGVNVKEATASVHVYDGEGVLAERGLWQRFRPKDDGGFAGAVIRPAHTGTYFIVVTLESSPEERTAWGVVYAYK